MQQNSEVSGRLSGQVELWEMKSGKKYVVYKGEKFRVYDNVLIKRARVFWAAFRLSVKCQKFVKDREAIILVAHGVGKRG